MTCKRITARPQLSHCLVFITGYMTLLLTIQYAGGRGKLFAARENGVHPSKRVSPAMSAPTDFAPPHVQPRSASFLSKCLLHYVC
jgi:hypothetical protein